MGVILIFVVFVVLAPIVWKHPRPDRRIKNFRSQPFEA